MYEELYGFALNPSLFRYAGLWLSHRFLGCDAIGDNRRAWSWYCQTAKQGGMEVAFSGTY